MLVASGRLAAMAFLLCASCAQPPPPAVPPAPPAHKPLYRAGVGNDEDCAPAPDGTPAKPLRIAYRGVAARARCDREVYTIMAGVSFALGVKCAHCHDESDYGRDAPRQRIANWMASELVPRLRSLDGREVWCASCHLVDAKGTAKILGTPRNRGRAVEWMTTVLCQELGGARGDRLTCPMCHDAPPATAGFRRQVILRTDLRLGPSAHAAPTSTSDPTSTSTPTPTSTSTSRPAPTSSPSPIGGELH